MIARVPPSALLLIGGLLLNPLLGCGAPVPPQPSRQDSKAAKVESSNAEVPDDGLPDTAQGLVEYMNRMSEPVTNPDPKEYGRELGRLMRSRAAAAKKLLAMESAAGYHVVAAKMRMES
ncbi:MAG TPA: hypothetical protein VIY86_02410, partial [Pirellulaceae bacterium]